MNQEVLLYNVAYDRAYYLDPINPNLDSVMIRKMREEQIRENILCYLGEFHLGVASGEFFYKAGEEYLEAYEPGPVRSQFKNGIWVVRAEGALAEREVAEYMGFRRLEKEILQKPDNTLFLWVNPAFAPNHHSITFAGQIISDEGERRVRIIANRNMYSIDEHRRFLEEFAAVAKHYVLDVDFLAHPAIFAPTDKIKTPEDLLTVTGITEDVDLTWKPRLTLATDQLLVDYLKMVTGETGDEELLTCNLQSTLLNLEQTADLL